MSKRVYHLKDGIKSICPWCQFCVQDKKTQMKSPILDPSLFTAPLFYKKILTSPVLHSDYFWSRYTGLDNQKIRPKIKQYSIQRFLFYQTVNYMWNLLKAGYLTHLKASKIPRRSNGLVVKVLDSQSRGPMSKTTGWLQGRLSLSDVDKVSTRNFWGLSGKK